MIIFNSYFSMIRIYLCRCHRINTRISELIFTVTRVILTTTFSIFEFIHYFKKPIFMLSGKLSLSNSPIQPCEWILLWYQRMFIFIHLFYDLFPSLEMLVSLHINYLMLFLITLLFNLIMVIKLIDTTKICIFLFFNCLDYFILWFTLQIHVQL